MLNNKPMVYGVRPLIIIGYKYNERKGLYFIATQEAGSTKVGITYLSNFIDPFSNFSIHPLDRPLVISTLFRSVNYVESHNKSMQPD